MTTTEQGRALVGEWAKQREAMLNGELCRPIDIGNAMAAWIAAQCDAAEREVKDTRCECCGYMTYHREHTGCIRAAKDAVERALGAMTDERIDEIKASIGWSEQWLHDFARGVAQEARAPLLARIDKLEAEHDRLRNVIGQMLTVSTSCAQLMLDLFEESAPSKSALANSGEG